jgi:integrase
LLISDGAGWKSRWGQKIELLPENPARERFLDRSELAKLLRGIPNRQIRKAALVAAFTGLRRGELASFDRSTYRAIYLPEGDEEWKA